MAQIAPKGDYCGSKSETEENVLQTDEEDQGRDLDFDAYGNREPAPEHGRGLGGGELPTASSASADPSFPCQGADGGAAILRTHLFQIAKNCAESMTSIRRNSFSTRFAIEVLPFTFYWMILALLRGPSSRNRDPE
jgi:hypothetical protein